MTITAVKDVSTNKSKQYFISVTGEVLWCKPYSVDKFDNYSTEVEFTKDDIKKLKTLGPNKRTLSKTKNEEGESVTKTVDGKTFIRFAKKGTSSKGNKVAGPVVVDKNNQPFKKAIGNGSKCLVQVHAREYEFQGAKGMSYDLRLIKVLDHVAYEPPQVDLESAGMSEEEYKNSTTQTNTNTDEDDYGEVGNISATVEDE